MNRLDVESWYEPLKEHTPAVFLLQISVQGTRASKRLAELNNTRRMVKDCDPNFQWNASEEKQVEDLKSLESKIGKIIKDNMLDEGCFIRFSKRSPKDAVLKYPELSRLSRQIEHKISAVRLERNQELILEEAMNQVIQVITEMLRVTNGSEAIRLLSNSQRIYQDLTLEFLEKSDQFVSEEDEFPQHTSLRLKDST